MFLQIIKTVSLNIFRDLQNIRQAIKYFKKGFKYDLATLDKVTTKKCAEKKLYMYVVFIKDNVFRWNSVYFESRCFIGQEKSMNDCNCLATLLLTYPCLLPTLLLREYIDKKKYH